jgi:hypothetical protein
MGATEFSETADNFVVGCAEGDEISDCSFVAFAEQSLRDQFGFVVQCNEFHGIASPQPLNSLYFLSDCEVGVD